MGKRIINMYISIWYKNVFWPFSLNDVSVLIMKRSLSFDEVIDESAVEDFFIDKFDHSFPMATIFMKLSFIKEPFLA